jgi:Bacterial membrane protein YfhO
MMKSALRHIGPLWPYAVMIGLPAAVFILPDVFGGHLLVTGDNLQQNYPLHALVGSMYRQGELPFWNQYIFSGTPLLAGFNAGAFYPLTGLFAVLPDRVAWITTEVMLFSLVAIGMYLYLRALRLSTTSCLLAAMTFSCSGVVLSQVSHVDMTEGFVSLPFMLLAMVHIVRDGRWRWSVLLGIAFALVIFGGAPEAMLDEGLLVLAYAALTAGLDRRRWWLVLSRGGTGAVLALSLSAVQWLPGIAAISNSQRSTFGAGFAATGSFAPANSLLSLVPYLFGGYGHIGEAKFFSHYNLPEVGIYVGILPVIALLTLWRPRWPSRLAPRERRTWYVIALLGLLLAFGANTPLEHIFNALPLYGRQRLQSRNMIDVSVALCVLFAGWLDRQEDPGRQALVTFDRGVACIPLGLVAGVTAWAVAAPRSLVTTLTTGSGSAVEVRTVREASLTALGFCLVAVVVVLLRSVMRQGRWLVIVVTFMAADLGLVAGTSSLVTVASNSLLAGRTTPEKYMAAHLSPGGRFAFYDPQEYASGITTADTGRPDANVLARLRSVGGYASIVNGSYNAATLTHSQGELRIPGLAAGVFRQLDLADILTAPEYFMVPVIGAPRSLAEVKQESEPAGDDPVLPLGNRANFTDSSYAFYPPPRPAIAAGRSSKWFFGKSLSASRATLLLAPGATPAQIRFGIVSSGGRTTWGQRVTVVRGATSVGSMLPQASAVGLTMQVISGHLPAYQSDVLVGQVTYELDGALSRAVQPGPWRQQGSVDEYTLYVRTKAPTPVYAIGPATEPAPPVEVLAQGDNSESIRVRTHAPVVVVRDVAWDGGWQASSSSNGGPVVTVPVEKRGLVQEVKLPPGNDVVRFSYQPRHWLVATVLSGGATLLLLLLLVDVGLRRIDRWGRWRRRHQPRDRVQPDDFENEASVFNRRGEPA